LKLNKRDCEIKIELTPYGANFLQVQWEIGGDLHFFYPNSLQCSQFSRFITAVYSLYSELFDDHRSRLDRKAIKREKHTWTDPILSEDQEVIVTYVEWDELGQYVTIVFKRLNRVSIHEFIDLIPDPVEIHISTFRGENQHFHYTVDGHDLAYAVSKAYTDAIRKYGFYGYYYSTGNSSDPGDVIDLQKLLFLKAYALDAMEVRKLKTMQIEERRWPHAEESPFEKEMELLLFDM